jgi:uncharacterized FlaG/YvyC family protein
MEVRPIVPPAPTPPVSPHSEGANHNQAEAAHRVPPPVEAKADNKARTDRHSQGNAPVTVPNVRLELRIDEGTNEVFGLVVNRDTGKPIREIPAKDLRRLQAISREMFGSMLDKTV